MATVDYSELSTSLYPADGFEFASFTSSTSTFYTYTTNIGHTVSLRGSGITTDGSNVPTGGTIEEIVISLSAGDPTANDVVVTDLNVDILDFDLTASGLGTEVLWRIILAGETDFILPDTPQPIYFAGDAMLQSSGLIVGSGLDINVVGAPTSITVGGVLAMEGTSAYLGQSKKLTATDSIYVSGDVLNQADNSFVQGGDDVVIAKSTNSSATMIVSGDSLSVNNNSVLVGGDDTVRFKGSATTVLMAGDAYATSSEGQVFGGDDKLYANNNVDSLIMAGDVFTGSGAVILQGGDDKIYAGNATTTQIYGDSSLPESDSVIGGDDIIFGGNTGVTTIFGGGGNDVIYAGGATDTLDGGAGKDTLNYSKSGSGVEVTLGSGVGSGGKSAGDTNTGFENLVGSNGGNDELTGDGKANKMDGKAGNDDIFGQGGKDNLIGGGGKDDLYGGGGSDKIYGGKGDDDMFGGKGNDKFYGGTGLDKMTGNGGEDTFHFDKGNDKVVIRDFQNNVDRIELDGFGNNFNWKANATKVGSDVVIDLGGANELVIKDTTVSQLSDDIFLV